MKTLTRPTTSIPSANTFISINPHDVHALLGYKFECLSNFMNCLYPILPNGEYLPEFEISKRGTLIVSFMAPPPDLGHIEITVAMGNEDFILTVTTNTVLQVLEGNTTAAVNFKTIEHAALWTSAEMGRLNIIPELWSFEDVERASDALKG